MKTIGIIIDFLNDTYRMQLDTCAKRFGYTTRYFENSEEAIGQVDDCEIIYGHCSKEVLRSARQLKWHCSCWAGVDHLCDDTLYHQPDCILSNSAGSYGTTIAEHLIMVCLMLLRRQPEYTEMVRNGGWAILDGGIRSLHGSRITVLGAGDIGTEFARRLRAFHPSKIIGIRRSVPSGDVAFDDVVTLEHLDELLPETDLLVMALPSTSETIGVLSKERIKRLPQNAFVVNVGRGTAIDQEALADALNQGHLAGAALDVTVPEPLPSEHPLRKAKNLLLTPHIAGNMTLEYTCDCNISLFCEDLENYVNHRPLLRQVDRRRGY